jgi:hypothetical protein
VERQEVEIIVTFTMKRTDFSLYCGSIDNKKSMFLRQLSGSYFKNN